MWQHKSVHDRLEELENKLSGFFRGVSSNGGDDHQITHLIHHMEKRLMATLDQLKAAIERDTSVTQSVITLLTGISQQLKDLIAAQGDKIDPAALDEIVAGIDANTDKLSAAVTANTPAG